MSEQFEQLAPGYRAYVRVYVKTIWRELFNCSLNRITH